MKRNIFYFLPMFFLLTFVSPLRSQDSDNSAKEETPVIAQNVETKKDTLDPNDYTSVDQMPSILSDAKPIYPPQALKKNIEGKVWLKVLVEANGNPSSIQVMKSTDTIFDKAAIAAAKNYKFEPALKDDKPVAVFVIIPFQFSLSKEPKQRQVSQDCYYENADEMPSIIGGMEAFMKKLVYPEIAQKTNIQGKVLFKVFVDEKGNVTATQILKGIGAGCEEAAEKTIRASKFTPAKQDGKNVQATVIFPIQFKLK
ncbi:MAG: energy transducer TonB [Ignavibacteriaceae bacterium]|jgi:TonB family protein